MLSVGGLFSGIGGWELGLERAGMRVLWHCESEPYCQRVLARHFPGDPIYDDVRTLRGADVEPIDVLCGGFPCQDLSYAGRGDGIDGARSGLWTEYARLIGELRPRYVLVENVPALAGRGLGRVLGDLVALGYDAEWDCLPASAVGAPHQRDRLWLIAYPQGDGRRQGREGRSTPGGQRESEPEWPLQVADSRGERCNGHAGQRGAGWPPSKRGKAGDHAQLGGPSSRTAGDHWAVEPDVGRVAHGVPARVDRLRALGNALVPQIAEWIGRRIVSYEEGVA